MHTTILKFPYWLAAIPHGTIIIVNDATEVSIRLDNRKVVLIIDRNIIRFPPSTICRLGGGDSALDLSNLLSEQSNAPDVSRKTTPSRNAGL